MSWLEGITLIVSGAVILALVRGFFSFLNAWMIRKERAARDPRQKHWAACA